MSFWTPELLSPAGSLEKLKVAVLYGANAVYLGGQKFGLRAAADNFTNEELKEGVEFAHARGSKVYVTLNSFLHDKDLTDLPEFLSLLDTLKVDSVIVSDLGVISMVQRHCSVPIHLSTQASCLNVEAAKLWKKMGVERVVLGREVSVSEAKKIKEEAQIEVEMFIHGSMCMAYSGNCVISNYTSGRDSNRGGCAHSCRFEYSLDFTNGEKPSEEQLKAHFMSSKDLEGIRVLPEFIEAGIDSLKVEGRMKAHLYAGTVSKVYSEALDHYKEKGDFITDDLIRWENELNKVTHREYTEASLREKAGPDTIYADREYESKEYVVCGVVAQVVPEEFLILEVRTAFFPNDLVEVLPFKGEAQSIEAHFITDLLGNLVEKTKPGTLVKIPYVPGSQEFNLVRKKVEGVSSQTEVRA